MKLVTVATVGIVRIPADTDEEALALASKMTFEDIEWSTDFTATDVEDVE